MLFPRFCDTISAYGKHLQKLANRKRICNTFDKKGKEKEIVKFYITDDANHLPVRLDLNLNFGTAKAYLTGAKGLRNPQTSKL